jgi:hypothetical protein
MTNMPNRRLFSTLAVLLSFVICGAAEGAQVTINSGTTSATFNVSASGVADELASIQDVATGRTVSFQTSVPMAGGSTKYNGAWSVFLRDNADPFGTNKWFTMGDAGIQASAAPIPPATTNPQTLPNGTIKYTLSFTGGALSFDNTTFSMTVLVQWRLYPGDPNLNCQVTVIVPNVNTTPFHVSQVVFPELLVRYIATQNDVHELVYPFDTGFLFENPVNSSNFPKAFSGPADDRAWITTKAALPFIAYYAKVTKNCLYFGDADLQAYWHDYEFDQDADSNNSKFMKLRCRHMPDDVFAKDTYTTPYTMQIRPFLGDWVDVAKAYHDVLASSDPTKIPYYNGPVGAASNPMTTTMKNLAFHAHLDTSLPTDNLDFFARDAMNTFRLAGVGGLLQWHVGFWPDMFDRFNLYGYLPGRPSFAAAVMEAQKQNGAVVAPYVNGDFGVDYLSLTPVPTPTQLMADVYDSAIRHEDGGRVEIQGSDKQHDNLFECNSDSAWGVNVRPNGLPGVLQGQVKDILSLTTTKCIYLDNFVTAPCFENSVNLPHGHKPGGGTYMWANRVQQLRDMRTTALTVNPNFSGIMTEGAYLWYSGSADVAHLMPLNMSVNLNSVLVTEVKSIPLFRIVVDSMKNSQFWEHIPVTSTNAVDNGRCGWLQAADVFAYGLIPHYENRQVDLYPSFGEGDESARAKAPYQRYFRRIVAALKNTGSPDDFLNFHNGTMDRSPDIAAQTPFAAAHPDAETGYNDAWFAAPNNYLVVGMYKAPPSGPKTRLALIVTNPWVGMSAPNFQLSTTFDPATYGFTGSYDVTRYDNLGTATTTTGVSGPFNIAQQIPPGEIWYWVFTG